jgi:hypothetical protein
MCINNEPDVCLFEDNALLHVDIPFTADHNWADDVLGPP